MKKLLLVAATLLTTNAFALSSDYKFVPLNNNEATNLCVVAAEEGLHAAKKVARQEGIFSDVAFNSTSCNDMSIRRFASQFKIESEVVESEEADSVNYIFRTKDQATASLVCKIAAEQGFDEALKVGGRQASNYVCNGLNIKRFARRYNKA